MMARTNNDPMTMRKRFGAALVDAMNARRVTQRALADELGSSQPAVSAWTRGEAVPEPRIVFRAEKYLGLPAGHLSAFLGFYPEPATTSSTTTLEMIVAGDPLFTEEQKRILLAVIRECRESAKPLRAGGRPSKSKV